MHSTVALVGRTHGLALGLNSPPFFTPLRSRGLQSSGVQVNPDCLAEFEAMKLRSAYSVTTA